MYLLQHDALLLGLCEIGSEHGIEVWGAGTQDGTVGRDLQTICYQDHITQQVLPARWRTSTK